MGRRLTLTYSERQMWRDCHRKHGYAYVEALRPEREAEPLRMGKVLHQALRVGVVELFASHSVHLGEAAARAELERALWAAVRDAGAASDEYAAEVTEEFARNRAWLEHSVAGYFGGADELLDRYRLLAAERAFSVPVADNSGRPHSLWYAGTMDLVLFDMLEQRVVVEDHKSTSGHPQQLERKLQLDEQTTGYLYAVRHMAQADCFVDSPLHAFLKTAPLRTFSGVAYNVFRKAAPRAPKNTKVTKADCPERYAELRQLEEATGQPQGKVSTAAIDTTVQMYADALWSQKERLGLAPTEKQRVRLEALELVAPYYVRLEYHRTERDLEAWRSEAWAEGRRIRQAYRDERARSRNPGHCTGAASYPCPYYALCVAGEPQRTRDGKPVLGYRRVDPKQEEGVTDGSSSARNTQGCDVRGERDGGGATTFNPTGGGGADYRIF